MKINTESVGEGIVNLEITICYEKTEEYYHIKSTNVNFFAQFYELSERESIQKFMIKKEVQKKMLAYQ